MDSIELRILMDEDPQQIRRALQEDLRALESRYAERVRKHIERGAERETIDRVRRIARNEYEVRRRENEAHLDWVRREVDTRGLVYRLRKAARTISRSLGARR